LRDRRDRSADFEDRRSEIETQLPAQPKGASKMVLIQIKASPLRLSGAETLAKLIWKADRC